MNNYRLTPLRDTTEHKKRISDTVRSETYLKQSKKSQPFRFGPILVSVCLMIIIVVLAAPYLNNAFFNKEHFTIEKIVLPNVPYDSLITSTYLDTSNEFIYTTDNGIFKYDLENSESSLLVSTNEVGRIYDYAVSEKWLVWAQPVNDEEKIHVLNRETLQTKILDIDYFGILQLTQDTILYINLGHQREAPTYSTYNLLTEKTAVLREIVGEGSNSRPAIDGTHLAISETIDINGQNQTTVSIHDIETLENLGSYSLPYEIAQNIQLKGEQLFGFLWNDNEPSVIGAIDLQNNQYDELETSVGIDDYATDGKHFAISVQKGDSNTVQLFTLEEGRLKRTSTIPSIKERLVLPRFTEQGTLVVNGEGADHAMYLIRFE